MTPEQINLVEATLSSISLDDLSADFYRRAFEDDPALATMFTNDPVVQRERFAAELDTIVGSIRDHEAFVQRAHALGVRHRDYGVRAVHFRLMGDALLAALAAALDERWTPDVCDAWRLAYNLVAEAMMAVEP